MNILDLGQQLENSTSSLVSTILEIPQQLTTDINTTFLGNELKELIRSLGPVVAALSPAWAESLFNNVTFLRDNLHSLVDFISTLPEAEVTRSSKEELVQLIVIGSTRFSLDTVWAPEVWAILLVFIYAICTKLTLWALVPQNPPLVEPSTPTDPFGAPEGTRSSNKGKEKRLLRLSLEEKARMIFRHASNLVISTVILALQLVAYRTFSVPDTSLTVGDFKLLSAATKLLVLPYGLELIFNQPHNHIWAHHVFTFLLVFIGQLTANATKDVLFFRLMQWWILQASTEQSTYLAMLSYHTSEYLALRHIHPRTQRFLLSLSARSMRFTSWITYPQKFIPIGFATYWIARMWNEESTYRFGRAWLAWCVILLILLVLMQFWFCDQSFGIAAHFEAKCRDEISRPLSGPVMTFFRSRLHQRTPRTGRRAREPKAWGSTEKMSLLDSNITSTPFQWPFEDTSPVKEWSSTLTLDNVPMSPGIPLKTPLTVTNAEFNRGEYKGEGVPWDHFL